MRLVDKIKALFKRKPKVVEEKPPEATEEKVVVKPKRESKPKDSSKFLLRTKEVNKKTLLESLLWTKEVNKKDAP